MRVYTQSCRPYGAVLFLCLICSITLLVPSVGAWESGGSGQHGFVDHYAVLGLELDADGKEVRQRYRQLAKENHPDLAVGDDRKKREAAERMAAINAAYTTLNNADSRATYDRLYHKVKWWAAPAGRGRDRDRTSAWPANVDVSTGAGGAPVWVVAYAACPAYVQHTYGSALASVVVCNCVWAMHLVLSLAFYLLHNRIRWGSGVPRRVSTGAVTGVFWRVLTGVVFALAASLPVLAAVVGVLYFDAVAVCALPVACFCLSAFAARRTLGPSSKAAAALWLPVRLVVDLVNKLDTRPESVVTHYGRVRVSHAEAVSLRAAEEQRRRLVHERRNALTEQQELAARCSLPSPSPFGALRLTPHYQGPSLPPTPSAIRSEGSVGRDSYLSPNYKPMRP